MVTYRAIGPDEADRIPAGARLDELVMRSLIREGASRKHLRLVLRHQGLSGAFSTDLDSCLWLLKIVLQRDWSVSLSFSTHLMPPEAVQHERDNVHPSPIPGKEILGHAAWLACDVCQQPPSAGWQVTLSQQTEGSGYSVSAWRSAASGRTLPEAVCRAFIQEQLDA